MLGASERETQVIQRTQGRQQTAYGCILLSHQHKGSVRPSPRTRAPSRRSAHLQVCFGLTWLVVHELSELSCFLILHSFLKTRWKTVTRAQRYTCINVYVDELKEDMSTRISLPYFSYLICFLCFFFKNLTTRYLDVLETPKVLLTLFWTESKKHQPDVLFNFPNTLLLLYLRSFLSFSMQFKIQILSHYAHGRRRKSQVRGRSCLYHQPTSLSYITL